MRTSSAPILLLLAPLWVAFAQSTASPRSPAPAPAGMASFRSEPLRLSYSYPSGYTDATSMVGPALQATLGGDPAAATAAKCISVPFSRMAPSPTPFSLVVLLRADAACFGRKFNAKSVAELTQGEAQGLAASGAKPNFGQVETFTLAKRPASRLRGSFTLPTGQAVQSEVVCVLDQPDIACWQFLAGSQGSLDTLTTFPVSFDGSSATPLSGGQSKSE